MKRNSLKSVFAFFAIALLFTGCKEEYNKPLYGSDSAPGPVSSPTFDPTPGGAVISYKLPDDANLLYVEAVVETPEGKTYSFKSSSFSNNVEIIGMASTEKQPVTLYSVSKGGSRSEGVTIDIEPLTPPYLEVYETLRLEEDFGGVNLYFENETNSQLAFVLSYLDPRNEEFIPYDVLYTDAKEGPVNGGHQFRGLEDVTTLFGVYVMDNWNNISPIFEEELTPKFETILDKTKFSKYAGLPGDGDAGDDGAANGYYNESESNMNYLWDGLVSYDINDPYAPADHKKFFVWKKIDEPGCFTFDLGLLSYITRIRVSYYYRWEHLMSKKYEVYGHADTPPADGSFDTWTLLGTVNNSKPSGLPVGAFGSGDAEAYAAGDNISVPDGLGRFRYIRIKSLESWGGTTSWCAAEINLWGDPRPESNE